MLESTELARVSTDRPTALDILIEEAQTAERGGRRDEARVMYELALRRLSSPSQASLASSLIRWIGRTYQLDADFEAALDCVAAALAVAEATGDEAAAGHAINVGAIVHWQRGDFDTAEEQYLLARERAQRAGEAKLMAMTAQNLGVIASIQGDLERAQRFFSSSLGEYRLLGLPKDVCIALNNLGKLYNEQQRAGDAELAFREALQISLAIEDRSTEILLHVNLAEVYTQQRRLDRAAQECDAAVEIARATGDEYALGEVRKLYGIIARESGDVVLAEEHFVAAEHLADARQDLLLCAQIAREQAELCRRAGRNRDTLRHLNRAHGVFTQLRARRELADVARRMGSLEEEFLDVVKKWGESIESKDRYTQGHCQRVADLSTALAARAGFDDKALFWYRIGALLHDVGKLVIPEEVLNKPGRLTEAEWALMRSHPAAGVEMLAGIDFPWDVRPIIESHHECWDGSGYPHGLAGEDIPLTARILCIADVYDALTSERSYKKPLPHEDAMAIMRRDVGRQFDPTLFPIFEQILASDPSLADLMVPRVLPPDAASAIAIAHPADDLTGLPLRRAIQDRAAELLGRSREGCAPLSLLVVDVDNFKLVNDTFGHLQGDDALRLVSRVLRATLREGDFPSRYAGDEFVVLLPGTEADEAVRIAERVRAAVEARPCDRRVGQGSITLTLSIGVASAPLHGETFETLFAAADRALYEAKRRGRNAVAGAADEPVGAVRRELRVEGFVGREAELRSLVACLESATRGEPRTVMLVGEAGIGKTTLVRQLAPEIRLRAGTLLVGRCAEADVKPPYGPWAEIIGGIRSLGIVPERVWRELPRLVPALARQGAADIGDAGSRYALFDEICEFLRIAAATRPLVIVLDDVQWGDSATWDVIEHVLHHLVDERIMICLTIRAEDAAPIADRRRRLTRDERCSEITLRRLARDELRSWVAAVFRQSDLDEQLSRFLHDQTEGNPLLVVQALRTMLDDGAIRHTGTRWEWRMTDSLHIPAAVRDLMARRLDRLSSRARELLALGAVVGRTFNVDIVLDACDASDDVLLDAIDEGVAADVLEPADGRRGDEYTFTHTLLTQAVRESVNPRRVRRMHERVGAALERHRPSQLAEIAGHYESAESPRAYPFAMKGGERALDVYAYEEARAFFEIAERRASTPDELADARFRAAHVAESSGSYEEGERICARALGELTEDAPRGLALRRLSERLQMLLGKPTQQTRAACEELLVRARAVGDDAEVAALLGMLSQVTGRLGDARGAEQLARECVAVAERVGAQRPLADAYVRLGSSLIEAHPAEALAQYARATQIFSTVDDRLGEIRCLINSAIANARLGALDDAEQSYARALELGRAARAPDLAGLASLNLGVQRMQRGDYEGADARFVEALALFTAVRHEKHRLAALYNRAHLARERGEPVAATDLYDACVQLAGKIGMPDVEIGAIAGLGLAALALGDGDAADRWHWVARLLIAIRDDWSFQGRELVEALGIRLAQARGEHMHARELFRDALSRAAVSDIYAACWLAADCGGSIVAAGDHAAREIIAGYALRAESLGFVPLTVRLAAIATPRARLSADGPFALIA